MRRPVKYLKMHTQPHVPGIGQFTNTFDTNTVHKGMTILYTDAGAIVAFKGVDFVVPLANIANAVFSGPEEGPETKRPDDEAKPKVIAPVK